MWDTPDASPNREICGVFPEYMELFLEHGHALFDLSPFKQNPWYETLQFCHRAQLQPEPQVYGPVRVKGQNRINVGDTLLFNSIHPLSSTFLELGCKGNRLGRVFIHPWAAHKAEISEGSEQWSYLFEPWRMMWHNCYHKQRYLFAFSNQSI